MDIFEKLEDFYHQKTFDNNWKKYCGNGDKKLDEIQVFLKFLKNKKEYIKNITSFNNNFKYKEKDVDEPGDLEYLGQIYQITHGRSDNYFQFQKNKNYQIKNQKKGLESKAFIIPAHDVALDGNNRLKFYFKDLTKKENMAKDNIILIIMYDHREKPKSNLKTNTRWKNIICVFNDGNLLIKNNKL